MNLGTRQRSIVARLMEAQYRCHLASHVKLGGRNQQMLDSTSIRSLVEHGLLKHYNYSLDQDGDLALPNWTLNELNRLQKRMNANPRGSSYYLIPDKHIGTLKKALTPNTKERLMKTFEFCIHKTEEYSGIIEIEASSEEEAKTLASKEILLIESGEKDLDTWIAGDETTIDEKALVNGDIETGFNWRELATNL